MRKQKGFSLIELLIVVAIILIIAAIAIPNLLRSKIAANESSAVASLRTIDTAQITYNVSYPEVGYASSLTALGPVSGTPSSTAAGLIDKVLSSGTKSGYTFTAGGGGTTFTISAAPTTQDATGVRTFCSDNQNVIYYGTGSCTVGSANVIQ